MRSKARMNKQPAIPFRGILGGLGVTFLLLVLPAQAYGASGDPAAARISSFYDLLVDTMKQAKQLGVSGRYQKLAPVLSKTYDLPLMSRIAVGQNWTALSAAERESIVSAFARMTTATYASRFDDFSGERFEVLQTADQSNGDKIVKTRIVQSDGKAVQLNYLMRNTGNEWKIIDVYLNGTISELAGRRAEFGSILKSGGPNALVSALTRQGDKLLTGG
jgi:phospholipid transport system substrate-binding protein